VQLQKESLAVERERLTIERERLTIERERLRIERRSLDLEEERVRSSYTYPNQSNHCGTSEFELYSSAFMNMMNNTSS
jgi:hypothetical protein